MNVENIKSLKIILPLIVIVATMFYFIIKAVKQSKSGIDTGKKTYFVEGMATGMALGVAVAVSLGRENIPMGISVGMLLGMAAGMNMKKKEK